MILVYGAAGSGKSEVAENIIKYLSKGDELIYMATMESVSEEAKRRISRHKKMREGKGFLTIEEPAKLSRHLEKIKDKFVLIECVSNLVANVFFSDEKDISITDDIDMICENAKEVVIVTNNIFEEGKSLDKMCDEYAKKLADINMALAKKSSCVVEVICGESIVLKGEKCWE